jgi:enoyl-CoA hydratase/carnithine racemase
MDERVKFAMEGGVANVRLTRAEKMNALDDAMFEALVATPVMIGTRSNTSPQKK